MLATASWDVAFFSGTINQHTSVFHATNWSTAWGTVMSHWSKSVSSLYQLQYYQPILILRSETGRVLKWTHCIFLSFGPISRHQLPYFHSYSTGHKTLHKWTQILIPTSPTGTARLNTVYMTFPRSAVKTAYSSAEWEWEVTGSQFCLRALLYFELWNSSPSPWRTGFL
jgi:hypothetical protein